MRKQYEEASPIQCKGLLPPCKPALKAVWVAAMQVRCLAARKQQLKSRVALIREPQLSNLVANLERVDTDRAVATVLIGHNLALQSLAAE